MPRIATQEDAETFKLHLLSKTDHDVLKAFKAASDRHNEEAAALCLDEMSRRNLTFEFSLPPETLRSAAELARRKSLLAKRASTALHSERPPKTALERLADYLDEAAAREERRSEAFSASGPAACIGPATRTASLH
jgi:hypothetical protein